MYHKLFVLTAIIFQLIVLPASQAATRDDPVEGAERLSRRSQAETLQEDIYPLLAFELRSPVSSHTAYLIGADHCFPYESYPDCLHTLIDNCIKDSSVLVDEHESINIDQNFLSKAGVLKTKTDENWSAEDVKKIYSDKKDKFSLQQQQDIEKVLEKLPYYEDLKLEYAVLLAIQASQHSEYSQGIAVILEGKFKKVLYLEPTENFLKDLMRRLSLSQLQNLLLEITAGENENLKPYREVFNIATLERLRKEGSPLLRKEKPIERNKSWINPLKGIIGQYNKACIIVGVNQLLLKNGLLDLLQKEKFSLQQLWSDGSFKPFSYQQSI